MQLYHSDAFFWGLNSTRRRIRRIRIPLLRQVAIELAKEVRPHHADGGEHANPEKAIREVVIMLIVYDLHMLIIYDSQMLIIHDLHMLLIYDLHMLIKYNVHMLII